MEKTRQAIIQSLRKHPNDDDKFLDEFQEIVKEKGILSYQVMLHVLTELDISLEKAPKCWREIVSHREKLSNVLGREIALKTAVCDYFSLVNKQLKHPKNIEILISEVGASSSKMDALTGLHSRNILEDFLEREIARSRRYDCAFSLTLFEVDQYQELIEQYGHLAGDLALKGFAKVILKLKRTEDIAVGCGRGRILLIMPETGKTNAVIVAERARVAVEKLGLMYEGEKLSLSVSAGLVTFPLDESHCKGLLNCGETALHQAKEKGRNRVHLFSSSKRKYMRLDFSAQIVINKLGFSQVNESLRAKSKDLSAGGLLFETGAPIDLGTKIEVNVILDKAADVLEIYGTVVRLEALESGKYEVGVSFLDMDVSTKKEISDYISLQLSK